MKNTLFYLAAMIAIFSSCKEKEVIIDACSNGFLDPGETGIDCGGNCAPCIPYEPSTIYLECNGIPMSMPIKTLVYDTSWLLTAANDSLTFQFNLGNSGTIGNFDLPTLGSFATKNGIFYMNSSNGVYAISAHNLTTKKMSGFFQANFFRNGFSDTLKVRNGQFEFLSY